MTHTYIHTIKQSLMYTERLTLYSCISPPNDAYLHTYNRTIFAYFFTTSTGKHMDIKNQNSRNLTRSSTSTGSTGTSSSTGTVLDTDMLYLLKSQDLG